MWFGDGSDTAKQAVELAKQHVRDTANFDWTFIALLALVAMVYAYFYKQKNWRALSGALALYSVHWFYEIMNACICAGSGYPLWTVSWGSSSYILLIGVCWELSMMFSIAGTLVNILPEDKHKKVLKIPNRLFYAVVAAAAFSLVEIFLASTPAFIWVYKWWGAIPVFITTYIPFFLAAFYVPDMKPKNQKIFIGGLTAINVLLLVILVPLGII